MTGSTGGPLACVPKGVLPARIPRIWGLLLRNPPHVRHRETPPVPFHRPGMSLCGGILAPSLPGPLVLPRSPLHSVHPGSGRVHRACVVPAHNPRRRARKRRVPFCPRPLCPYPRIVQPWPCRSWCGMP